MGDVAPAQLPLAERLRLAKYVADRGGTLVILAGKRAMPLAYLEGRKDVGAEGDPLLNLLPIEEARAVAPLKGFPVTLTDEGQQRTRYLEMDETPEDSRAAGPSSRATSGESLAGPRRTRCRWLYEPDEEPGIKVDRAAQEKERALIVRQNYGFGRVLFVGLDSTWRWRFKIGDTYHHRFWGQLVRWAASDKPLVAGNEHLRFGTPEPVYRKGQEVDVVVRLSDELGGPGKPPLSPTALAGARILRPAKDGKGEEAVALVPLGRKEAQPRVLEGQVPRSAGRALQHRAGHPGAGRQAAGPRRPRRPTGQAAGHVHGGAAGEPGDDRAGDQLAAAARPGGQERRHRLHAGECRRAGQRARRRRRQGRDPDRSSSGKSGGR